MQLHTLSGNFGVLGFSYWELIRFSIFVSPLLCYPLFLWVSRRQVSYYGDLRPLVRAALDTACAVAGGRGRAKGQVLTYASFVALVAVVGLIALNAKFVKK